jgi:hypothetical protein
MAGRDRDIMNHGGRQGLAMAGWIDDIAAGLARVGHDKTSGSKWDDGATYTSDGVHYAGPGRAGEAAVKWQEAMFEG